VAWIRQLKSGLWAATVRTNPADPTQRITETSEIKTEIERWAADLETDIRRGEFIDPRLARTTVAEVWERFNGARRLEDASRKRDKSQWRCHVKPRWGHIAVGDVLKPDVSAWVNAMEEAVDEHGVRLIGDWTIIGSANVLRAVLGLAVDAGMIRYNPASKVRLPIPPEHIDRVISADEEEIMLARLDERFPGRRDAGLFVASLLETGGRWEEVAAVAQEAVDLQRGKIRLGPVMERDGTIRAYPKGARNRHAAGFRNAVISPELVKRLRPVVLATPPCEHPEHGRNRHVCEGLVYTAARGGPMRYPTWLRRVWAVGVAELAEPRPTPHDCRHSHGTRLADAGLERHDIMAEMGHRDYRSSGRYVHSDEDRRHERIEEARRRERERRQAGEA
jgi:integrase